jgi:hypothetical protein
MPFMKSAVALAAACVAMFSLTMVVRRNKRQARKGRRARG